MLGIEGILPKTFYNVGSLHRQHTKKQVVWFLFEAIIRPSSLFFSVQKSVSRGMKEKLFFTKSDLGSNEATFPGLLATKIVAAASTNFI